MAYELTHIRFAHTLHGVLGITNDAEYYAGSVYPDSRYMTGIHRDQTHRDGFPDLFDVSRDDFEKGWATHTFYDTVSLRHWERLGKERGAITFENAKWIELTAMKLVQDLDALEAMSDHMDLIRSVNTNRCPRNENPDKLAAYYAMLRELYGGTPNFDDFEQMWVRLGGTSEGTVRAISQQAKAMLENRDFAIQVKEVFDLVRQEVFERM